MKYLLRLFFLLPLLILNGCKCDIIPKENNVNARVIEYKVTYLNEKAGTIPTSVLPTRMTVVFAGHHAHTRIEGFLGQFSLTYIANLRNSSVITMLKIFDRKLVYYGNKGEFPVGIEPIESIKISELESNIVFAGFACDKLLISSSNHDDFFVFCTDQINVRKPNAATPFKDISEVLLSFNTSLSLLEMQLNALKYEEREIPRVILRVPEDYINVSRKDIELVINELFK